MRSIILTLVLIFSFGASYGQLVPQVDERIELTGVAFRLAGIPEYSEGLLEEYNQDIDAYFSPYRYHPLIGYLVKLRNEDRLGYAVVAGSTMYITIRDGRVVLNPQVTLSELHGLGTQWRDEKTFRKYIRLLDDFYRTTRFRKFYQAHQPLYAEVKESAEYILSYFNEAWFTEFFGVPFTTPTVYIALGNGRSNYYIGEQADGGYAIVLGGRQQFSFESIYPSMIHELCHHYTNPLFDRYWPSMQQAAEAIYERVKEDMWANAYGSAEDTCVEWLNNLCTSMYFRENIHPLYRLYYSELRDRGFIWLPQSVQFMDNFYEHRDKYPCFDAFMPQVVEFLRNVAENFDVIQYAYDHRHPYITGIFPANGSNIGDEGFTEIKISFSQPMSRDAYTIGYIEDDEQVEKLPCSESINAFWKDEHTFVIPIEPSRLDKNKRYGLILKATGFTTEDYNYIEKDFIIEYHTRAH